MTKQIPFEINNSKSTNDANEDIRLEYRFLDLREERMLNNLRLRHKFLLLVRNFFDKQGYIEVETPILGKSTLREREITWFLLEEKEDFCIAPITTTI